MSTTTQELIPVESVNALQLFVEDSQQLDGLLTEIERAATSFEPDTETPKGRSEIASQAYKVARSKVVIDDAGKELVRDWKEKAKRVDAGRKRARDFLDELKAKVRAPLDEWEAEQERIKEAERLAAEREAAHAEALAMNDLFDREAAVAAERANLEAEKAEREERERIAREAAERKEREERIAREAEERAKREAAEALQREREAREQAERQAKEAAERAKREAEEAVERERQKAAKEAAEREAQRRAAEDQKRREEAARQADREHRRTINAAIVAAFLEEGLQESQAQDIVRLVASGSIPHMRINY